MGSQSVPLPPKMSLLPYSSRAYGYGYPANYYGGYGAAYGAGYPYGPYGMTAEEIQKVREAEAKRKEFMEAEKAKYEEFVAAEKKKYEDYVSAQEAAVKEAIAKEKELAEKLGPYAYGPYGPAGAHGGRGYGYGYGHPYGHGYGYGHPAYGYGGRYY